MGDKEQIGINRQRKNRVVAEGIVAGGDGKVVGLGGHILQPEQAGDLESAAVGSGKADDNGFALRVDVQRVGIQNHRALLEGTPGVILINVATAGDGKPVPPAGIVLPAKGEGIGHELEGTVGIGRPTVAPDACRISVGVEACQRVINSLSAAVGVISDRGPESAAQV